MRDFFANATAQTANAFKNATAAVVNYTENTAVPAIRNATVSHPLGRRGREVIMVAGCAMVGVVALSCLGMVASQCMGSGEVALAVAALQHRG